MFLYSLTDQLSFQLLNVKYIQDVNILHSKCLAYMFWPSAAQTKVDSRLSSEYILVSVKQSLQGAVDSVRLLITISSGGISGLQVFTVREAERERVSGQRDL